MSRLLPFALLGACLSGTACYTGLSVERVEPGKPRESTPNGVRYSLPRPVLQVQRDAKGIVDVKVLFLPDERRTYAIDACSVFGDHDLEIAVKDGLLTKVAWNADTSAVASELVGTASSLGKELLEERNKREEERDKERKDREQEIEDARESVQTAKDALEVEVAKLRAMQRYGASEDAIRNQRVVVATKEQELRQKEAALAALLDSLPESVSAESQESATQDPDGAPVEGQEKVVEGPKAVEDGAAPLEYFEIVPTTEGGVELKRATVLGGLPSIKPAEKPPLTLKPKEVEPLVLPSPAAVRVARANLRRVLARVDVIVEHGSDEQIADAMVALTEAEASLNEAEALVFHVVSNRRAGAGGLEVCGRWKRVARVEQVSRTEWRIELHRRIKPGRYVIGFRLDGETFSIPFTCASRHR